MPLIGRTTLWECPNCEHRDWTHEANPHTRFHSCPGMKGLTAPMVEAGTRCEVRAVEREDYIAGENVTLDADGRPVMAIETVRDEGNDVVVFAPCATTQVFGSDT